MLVRVKNADCHLQFLSDDPYWLCEVGIVRYEHRRFELLAEGIPNEVRCKVNI
jgi:hypothetical protein